MPKKELLSIRDIIKPVRQSDHGLGKANQIGGQGQWIFSGTLGKVTVQIAYNVGSSKKLNFTRYDAACMKFNGNILCIKSRSCN